MDRHWWLMPITLATQETEVRRIVLQSQAWANSTLDPILKKSSQKRFGGVVQVVECLPSQCEALSSNPSTAEE
jgi:hypothetical protein